MALAPVVALDIGTSKVCALVGEAREEGNMMITGMGLCPSVSIRKGIILDIDAVSNCIGNAIEAAEENSSVNIRQVYLIVSGAHIQSLINPGTIPVSNPDHGVTLDDIEEVKDIARAVSLPHDREIIHSIPGRYSVDDQRDMINPEGMHGATLSIDMLVIHGSRNLLNNSVKCVGSAGLRIGGVMFDCLCSSLATLTPEQKKCGVVLIDVGAGTSSYLVFDDDVVAASGVLGVGGDHITNDIALGFGISRIPAEQLKRESGSAVLDPSSHVQQIPVPSDMGFSACSVVVSDLNTIINARVNEMFTLIKNDLAKKLNLGRLAGGVVLTGGGAHLKGIETAAADVFDMPCVVGKPRNFSGMASVYEGPEYAAALGMIRHASREALVAARDGSLKGWFRRVIGAR